MRAKELIPILADEIGIPFETAYVIDRSLAEHGFRVKGKGRAWPEMTRKEALNFLIACMVTVKTTKAGEEAKFWINSKTIIHKVPDYVVENYAPVDWSEVSKAEQLTYSLVDYLLIIMNEMEGLDWDPNVSLKLITSVGRAEITYGTLDGESEYTANFYNGDDVNCHNPDGLTSMIKKVVTVDDGAFHEIMDRTENPLKGGKE